MDKGDYHREIIFPKWYVFFFNTILIKIPSGLWVEIDKLILKLLQQRKKWEKMNKTFYMKIGQGYMPVLTDVEIF